MSVPLAQPQGRAVFLVGLLGLGKPAGLGCPRAEDWAFRQQGTSAGTSTGLSVLRSVCWAVPALGPPWARGRGKRSLCGPPAKVLQVAPFQRRKLPFGRKRKCRLFGGCDNLEENAVARMWHGENSHSLKDNATKGSLSNKGLLCLHRQLCVRKRDFSPPARAPSCWGLSLPVVEMSRLFRAEACLSEPLTRRLLPARKALSTGAPCPRGSVGTVAGPHLPACGSPWLPWRCAWAWLSRASC